MMVGTRGTCDVKYGYWAYVGVLWGGRKDIMGLAATGEPIPMPTDTGVVDADPLLVLRTVLDEGLGESLVFTAAL